MRVAKGDKSPRTGVCVAGRGEKTDAALVSREWEPDTIVAGTVLLRESESGKGGQE